MPDSLISLYLLLPLFATLLNEADLSSGVESRERRERFNSTRRNLHGLRRCLAVRADARTSNEVSVLHGNRTRVCIHL